MTGIRVFFSCFVFSRALGNTSNDLEQENQLRAQYSFVDIEQYVEHRDVPLDHVYEERYKRSVKQALGETDDTVDMFKLALIHNAKRAPGAWPASRLYLSLGFDDLRSIEVIKLDEHLTKNIRGIAQVLPMPKAWIFTKVIISLLLFWR